MGEREKDSQPSTPFSNALRVNEGFGLSEVSPRSKPASEGRKKDGEKLLAANSPEIDERVHDLVPPPRGKRGYATIDTFEGKLAAEGTILIKVMMHVSKEEQKERPEHLRPLDLTWPTADFTVATQRARLAKS